MMHWQYTPYVVPLLIAAAISAALALSAWRRGSTPGATSLALLMLVVVEWSLGYALEIGSADLPAKVLWAKFQYLGIVTVPVAWLAFVLQYTGREKWLTRPHLVLLAIEPLVTLPLAWTNEVHGLIWSNIRLANTGSLSVLDVSYGPWFWVHMTYSYLLLLLGSLLLLQVLFRSPRLYRGQASALLIAALAPWAGNALYISALTPLSHLDLTPFAFVITGPVVIWGLLRFRLLDIAPVARDAVIASMGEGIIVLDRQNHIVDLNPAAQRIIGRAASEAIGQRATEVLPSRPDGSAELAEVLVERYPDMTEAHEEIALGEGEAQRYYDLRILPLRDRRGRSIGRLAVMHEITERVQAEEALRQLKEFNESIVNSIGEGLLMKDTDGHITFVNPVMAQLLGCVPEELLGQHWTVIVPAEQQARVAQQNGRCAKGVGGSYEATLLRKDGHEVPVIASTRPLVDHGRFSSVLSVFTDVTERKRQEEQVRAQERLAAVGQLAAGIAHDFNNILTSTIGFAELVHMRADVPESAKVDLKAIVEGGHRAAHLIEQILDFSRKSLIQRQPLDLTLFLKGITKFLQRTIPENIHIVLEIGPEEYRVNADTTRIQQVLTNLAVNARDAMTEGGELRIGLKRVTFEPDEQSPFPGMEPGEWIRLSVSDTGVGIAPELLPHIYEPFFTTKEPGRGSGLGLAQVYGIVKQHGGYIDVETEVGKGTTFIVYLRPLAVGEEERREGISQAIDRGQGETILVVEDEPLVLGICKSMVEHLGYRALAAATGEQGLALYERHQGEIVLVLSDMVMPQMGGVELFQELRERDPEVRVVMMTGYPLGGEGRESLARGITGWVQKPLDLVQLAQVMNRVLR